MTREKFLFMIVVMEKVYNFLTIRSVPDWEIGSLNTVHRIIPNVNWIVANK